jgi:hypothetical protein
MLPRLTPQREMGRNEPCWCGSRKKWKHCHRDRETQIPLNISSLIESRRNNAVTGVCLHPDAGPNSCGPVINAHTVQKRGGLAAVAESGHVKTFRPPIGRLPLDPLDAPPWRISVNKATTFMGFCDKHDGEMFKPAERRGAQLNADVVFLLSFRALCLELFSKRVAIENTMLQAQMDKGKPFEQQCEFQAFIHSLTTGLRLGLTDLELWKSRYDEVYRGQNLDACGHCGVIFDRILPVVASGAFQPEFDFSGNMTQRLGLEKSYEFVALNLTVMDGKSVVGLGWMGRIGGPAETFVRSYYSLPDGDKADAALRMAFQQLENVCFKPSWWDGLPLQVHDDILRLAFTGLLDPRLQPSPSSLRAPPVHYVDANVTQRLFQLPRVPAASD